jgi:hypothetical protein
LQFSCVGGFPAENFPLGGIVKRIFLVLAAFCLVAQTQAETPSNIRLKLVISGPPGGPTKTLSVGYDGVVTLDSCQAIYPTPCQPTRVIDYLNNFELNRIDRLIERAAHGTVVQVTGIHCMTMPIHYYTYSANNDRVFLRSQGVPCGLPKYNTSLAAEKLVKILDALNAKVEAQ